MFEEGVGGGRDLVEHDGGGAHEHGLCGRGAACDGSERGGGQEGEGVGVGEDGEGVAVGERVGDIGHVEGAGDRDFNF